MLPSERLLDILKQPFSYSYLPTVERHRAIEKCVSQPLESVVRSIAKFKDVSFEQLAALIQASEAARILA